MSPQPPEKNFAGDSLAGAIDHTLLSREARPEAIERLCREALEFGFRGVCVYPEFITQVAGLLAGSPVLPVSVVGFPTGLDATSAKVAEAGKAVADGARELDMVVNLAALKEKDFALVFEDMAAVVRAVQGVPVKVILETAALDEGELLAGCALAQAAGASFVKTSTGFGPGGASVRDVALLARWAGGRMKVKASGGIKSRADALAMLAAGADVIGASASVAIITGK